MNHDLNRIARNHKGLGLLQANKKSFDDHMNEHGLYFWLAVIGASVSGFALITALQALRVLIE